MKTTLDLEDDLLAQAKVRAAEAGVSLKALVEEALRARLVPPPSPRPVFRWNPPVVCGDRPPAVDVADRRALHDFMDEPE